MDICKRILWINAMLAVSTVALAEEDLLKDEFEPFWEINIMGGISAVDADDGTITIYSADGDAVETDALTQTNDNDWDWGTGRVGLGYVMAISDEIEEDEFIWFPFITPQINLYYSKGDLDGEVYRYEHEDFNNQSFSMDFSSIRAMLDLSLTIASYEHLSLYTLGGVGLSWNQLEFSAKDHQADCDCIVGLPSSSEDSTSFAWEAGVGMSYAALDYLTVSLEYLYTGFGDVDLGDSDEPFHTEGSDLDLSAQSLLLGLRVAL